ncbi:unnamed protein product [Mytilus coruscus]|uniref:Uncharacterized protein n=1 Tax=Mytilus coruscus TaxID=42192 RepID=A0A6J8C5L5_MYTCO|nr:unnamed protein product [Mytilus coruscus]
MMLQSQKGGTHFINDNNHNTRKDNPVDHLHQMWNTQQTEAQKQFQETGQLSRQEHYMNGFHQDHHQIPKIDYNSNKTCQLGNINSQLPFPGNAPEQLHLSQHMGSNKQRSEKDYNSSMLDHLNNRDNRPYLPRQRNDQEYQHQMAKRECHLNAHHQDHQVRHTDEFNHTKRTVHRKHINDIQDQTTGWAEAHKNAYQHNYHQPHHVQGHSNKHLKQDTKIQHIQQFQMQNSSQESLNMLKNIPVHNEQHQYSQPPSYVHQMENIHVGTCKPTNFQQMVVNPASQLPTRSMEHQNRHRAAATCDSRNIPNRKFLLPPPYSQSQSNFKPFHSTPDVERKQTIPQQQINNIPKTKDFYRKQ